MRRLPPLNAVRIFEAAARHASFQRAAGELHVTASAVSHQIRALEEFLGTSLFRRDGRRVHLTAAGESYLQAAREGLALIAAATERVAAPRPGGVFTLSVAPAFATPWLAPRLAAFQLDHPELEIRLVSSIEIVDFRKSDVDAAVRHGAGKWPGLIAHRLFAEELIPVASPGYRIGTRRLRTPADLRKATLLHAAFRPGQWRTWCNAAGIADIEAEAGPRFHTLPLALEAAIAGRGVAIAARELIDDYLRSGQLVTLFDVTLASEHAYYFVYPEERANNPNIALVREWLLAEAKDVAPARARKAAPRRIRRKPAKVRGTNRRRDKS